MLETSALSSFYGRNLTFIKFISNCLQTQTPAKNCNQAVEGLALWPNKGTFCDANSKWPKSPLCGCIGHPLNLSLVTRKHSSHGTKYCVNYYTCLQFFLWVTRFLRYRTFIKVMKWNFVFSLCGETCPYSTTSKRLVQPRVSLFGEKSGRCPIPGEDLLEAFAVLRRTWRLSRHVGTDANTSVMAAVTQRVFNLFRVNFDHVLANYAKVAYHLSELEHRIHHFSQTDKCICSNRPSSSSGDQFGQRQRCRFLQNHLCLWTDRSGRQVLTNGKCRSCQKQGKPSRV